MLRLDEEGNQGALRGTHREHERRFPYQRPLNSLILQLAQDFLLRLGGIGDAISTIDFDELLQLVHVGLLLLIHPELESLLLLNRRHELGVVAAIVLDRAVREPHRMRAHGVQKVLRRRRYGVWRRVGHMRRVGRMYLGGRRRRVRRRRAGRRTEPQPYVRLARTPRTHSKMRSQAQPQHALTCPYALVPKRRGVTLRSRSRRAERTVPSAPCRAHAHLGVGDDEQALGVVCEMFLEPHTRLEVEVVRRLIEQQQLQ